MTSLDRRIVQPALALTVALGIGGAAAAQESAAVRLFKIVSPHDEIVVGVSDPDLRSLGPGSDLDNLAGRLAASGHLEVWQYAVKKGDDGALRQAPLRRVAVFRNDLLRIEPVATPLPVLAPPVD